MKLNHSGIKPPKEKHKIKMQYFKRSEKRKEKWNKTKEKKRKEKFNLMRKYILKLQIF